MLPAWAPAHVHVHWQRVLAMGRECVICLSEPRDTTVLPCRHMCMCNKCANELRNQPQTNKCPICRTPVDQLLEIKIKSSSKT